MLALESAMAYFIQYLNLLDVSNVGANYYCVADLLLGGAESKKRKFETVKLLKQKP